MSAEGMSSKYLDKSTKFYEIGMKNIKMQLKFLGTKFLVNRPTDGSKWKNVFGGSYSSDSKLENDYEQTETTLLINLNDLRDVWSRNRDSVEVYSDKDDVQVGDELQYTRDKRTYRFKVVLKQGYSETANVIYNYTLMSIIETLDE